jgi:CheY-like chemotaxis protein
MADPAISVAQPEDTTGSEPLAGLVALGRMTAGIAHDLNNLLTIMQMQLDQLRPAIEPQRASLLEGLQLGLRQATELTGRLVSVVRQKGSGRSGALPAHNSEVTDLATVAAEIAGLLRRSQNPQVAVEVQAEPNLPAVHGEPGLVTQILLNLCLNAYDAMPRGGQLLIEIGRQAAATPDAAAALISGSEVYLRVRDSGVGIALEDQQRIFEPFFSTKPGARHAGLGLAIVADSVRQVGGRIACQSSPGQGTCFEVVLPVDQDLTESAAGLLNSQTRSVSEGKPQSRCTREPSAVGGGAVLVVDNDAVVRRLAKAVLEGNGYPVLLADNGHEAIDMYRRQHERIAVVLLDWLMPGLLGAEALEELRQINPGVRVVLTSGSLLEPADLSSGDSRSVVPIVPPVFLAKPYHTRDLLAAVTAILGKPDG